MDKYSKKVEEIWKSEREKLKNEIKRNRIPEWLDVKINKKIKRIFLDKKYEKIVKETLVNDDFLLSLLMKDPKRQNIYEKIFKDELVKEGFDVQKLKASGLMHFTY